MKKTGLRLCLLTLICGILFIMSTVSGFGAEKFAITDSSPKDGQKNTAVENVGVKLTFNQPVNSKENRKANDSCFKLTDPKGKKLPIKVYYNEDKPMQMLVLYDNTTPGKNGIKGNSEYKLQIDGALKSSRGDTLKKDVSITFKTLNQRLNTGIYMGMMALMMIAMVIISAKMARKQNAGDKTQMLDEKEEPFNPYKEARKTGKSLEQVIAEHKKEVEKREAKRAKQRARNPEPEEDIEEEEEMPGRYHVHRVRTVASAGSSYITGRKAAAEAARAEQERLARRRAKRVKGKRKK